MSGFCASTFRFRDILYWVMHFCIEKLESNAIEYFTIFLPGYYYVEHLPKNVIDFTVRTIADSQSDKFIIHHSPNDSEV